MKKFMKKVTLFSVVFCLIVAANFNVGNAAVKVVLKKNQPYTSSDYKRCRQSSGDGKVYADSEKKVAWVLEYRGTDGQWHYQKPVAKWPRFSPGTSVPVQTGYIYNYCDQRLQLNPYGTGDSGKGGHALGYFYVIQ